MIHKWRRVVMDCLDSRNDLQVDLSGWAGVLMGESDTRFLAGAARVGRKSRQWMELL
jgi:hypothetical protein